MKGNSTYYTTASDFKSEFVEMFGTIDEPKVEVKNNNEVVWQTIPSEFQGTWIDSHQSQKLVVSNNHITFKKYDRRHYYSRRESTYEELREPKEWLTIVDSDVNVKTYRKGGDLYLTLTSRPYVNINPEIKIPEVELFFSDENELYLVGPYCRSTSLKK